MPMVQYYSAVGVIADHWQHLKLYVGFLEAQYARTGIKVLRGRGSLALNLGHFTAVCPASLLTVVDDIYTRPDRCCSP